MPFAAPIARALLRSQSDERLVRLARDGHQGAFDEIVRRYRAPLVAFAAGYATVGKAEDVVQESLTNAWVSLQSSQHEIALKPWLYTIVRNRALNARRDARWHEPLSETIDGVRRPEEIVLERDELSRAVAAVTALPAAQRKALVDSAIEGRTHDQIAAELGTSAGAVRGMIHRGRVAVRGAAGSVVPFPVVAWAAGSGGAAAGGVAAGGVAAGSIAGGSLAAKGATVAAIAILATGSGIVVERSLDDSAKTDREASAEGSPGRDGARGDAHGAGAGKGPGDDNPGPGDDRDKRDRDDDSRRGPDEAEDGDDDDDSKPGGGDDDDPSGHSRGGNSGPGSANSGPGSDDSGSPPDDDSSGHGSGGGDDDSSGSGSGSDDDSSGSGSGSDDDSSDPETGDDDDSDSDDDSSGSGSDDD